MTPAPTTSGGGRRRVRALDEVLDLQRRRDLLGPEPNASLRAHSAAYAATLDGPPPATVVDLGSGGGVPGLVLAAEVWPSTSFTLLDASQRRCTYLELSVADLGLSDRVGVVWARAEEAGRSDLRGEADVVVARSFGPPAATAECAAPLLRVGGALVVSEPPGSGGERWDPTGLDQLGMVVETTTVVEGATFTVLRQTRACPDLYPRRPGIPTRRPLF